MPVEPRQETTVSYLLQYLELVNGYHAVIPYSYCFRGQSKKWPLQPAAFRSAAIAGAALTDDLWKFQVWRHSAVAYNDDLPADDLNCLAFARHHGMHTRLLDWSSNPLVAIYFACCDHPSDEGIVYVMDVIHPMIEYKEDHDTKLEEHDTGTLFIPMPFSKLILHQNRCFTIHQHRDHDIEELTGIDIIRIPAAAKVAILFDLHKYGVNHSTLFPDLDGFSRHHNWLMQFTCRQNEKQVRYLDVNERTND